MIGLSIVHYSVLTLIYSAVAMDRTFTINFYLFGTCLFYQCNAGFSFLILQLLEPLDR